MASLLEITHFLDELLPTSPYEDRSLNGVQVEGNNDFVKTVGLAVDAGLSVIEEAVRLNCDLLFVHHGMFWGTEAPVRGPLRKKLYTLLTNNLCLYASHLPLDGHPELGNGAQVAKFFDLGEVKPFINHRGGPIGVRACCKEPKQLQYFEDLARTMIGSGPVSSLSFGHKEITSVAIATGAASFTIDVCAKNGIHLLITGESEQAAYHAARELGINVLFAGHYATETFGVRAVGNVLNERFNVQTVFIDQPTGI